APLPGREAVVIGERVGRLERFVLDDRGDPDRDWPARARARKRGRRTRGRERDRELHALARKEPAHLLIEDRTAERRVDPGRDEDGFANGRAVVVELDADGGIEGLALVDVVRKSGQCEGKGLAGDGSVGARGRGGHGRDRETGNERNDALLHSTLR